MPSIVDMIYEAKKSKEDLVATTVRVPRETQLAVEDLADYLSISKQETMLKLIETGLEMAENAKAKDDTASSKFYLVNTNKRHDIDMHRNMLETGHVAATYSPWKFKINKMKEDDIVFLYENGVGIVAYGKSTGQTLKKNYQGEENELHYQELKEFKKLINPLKAAQIKEVLERKILFLQVMHGMPDGQKLIDYIEQNKC